METRRGPRWTGFRTHEGSLTGPRDSQSSLIRTEGDMPTPIGELAEGWGGEWVANYLPSWDSKSGVG